jgi:hypothetical protein
LQQFNKNYLTCLYAQDHCRQNQESILGSFALEYISRHLRFIADDDCSINSLAGLPLAIIIDAIHQSLTQIEWLNLGEFRALDFDCCGVETSININYSRTF